MRGLRNMRRIAHIALAGAFTPALLTAQTSASRAELPALRAGTVALQISAGVPASVVGFVAGGLTARAISRAFGADDTRNTRVAYIGAFGGAALATAGTAAWIGSRSVRLPNAPAESGKVRVHGSYGAAVGGALLGGAVSALLRKAGRSGALGERGPLAIMSGIAIFVLPSVGASVAYNATRKQY